MNKNVENQIGTSSKEWFERLEHEEIMDNISKMKGCVNITFCDHGHCDYWRIENEPSIDELKKIVQRGVHEEILHLIHQYGKCLPESGMRNTGCIACRGQFLNGVYMPDVIQGMIARRGIKAEMEAFASYYGFVESGQDAILERGNHEEIMWYLSLHGLLPMQQKKLFERGNMDEITLHIRKHGMSDELVLKMLENIDNKGCGKELFYLCIEGGKFSQKCQKYLLDVLNEPEFLAYVSRHELHDSLHFDMVKKRTPIEVRFYIEKYKYLSVDACEEYVRNANTEDRLFFLSSASNGIESVLAALLSLSPMDEKVLEYAFLNYNYDRFDVVNKREVLLMKNGSEAEIKEYVTKRPSLCVKAWATLFFCKRSLYLDCIAICKNKRKK